MAVGMIVATVVGYFLYDTEAQNLICVGAFLGGIAALMPHHRSRIVAAVGTGAAEVVAASIGILLHDSWWLLLPLIAVGFFAGGVVRVVGIGVSMRVLVVTIIVVAFAEITPSAQAGAHELALFSGGVAIMAACQFLPPFEPRHAVQRESVAALYDALAAGGSYGPALMAADHSLALVHRSGSREVARLTRLTEQGEHIGQLLHALDNRSEASTADDGRRGELAQVLSELADGVRHRRTPNRRSVRPAEADGLWLALDTSIATAIELISGTVVDDVPDNRTPPTPFELVRDELHPGAPMFRHAVRLATAGVVGELVGRAIGFFAGPDLLPAHGFWVCLTVVLVLFPDYGDASSRGIGRTVGTVIGALAGVAISFLPANQVLHTVVLIVLLLGYLTFRSCGQPWTMMWVVMWISTLSTGPLGAVTRGLDTVVGAALALCVYLLLPTWQRERLAGLMATWMRSQADQIRALRRMWARPDETGAAEVAHATVRSRLARLEFSAAAQQARYDPADPAGRWKDAEIEQVSRRVYEVAKQSAVVAALGPGPDGTADAETLSATGELAADLDDLADRIEHVHASRNRSPLQSTGLVDDAESDIRIATSRAAEAIGELAAALRYALGSG
ncbi:FUSC family protein [Nocardia sp. CA2R105]|uniref:FUSC family protein n=1 Tax=Nocardia coffeae TaxID=2873381 RepID=UPI001CA65FF6|nr:FUSC family protein [Nocardia coffeae]MBY8856915.1 FUSC family protein [Nocardia coffeae]